MVRNISAKYDKKNKQDGGAIVRKVCTISFLEENNKNLKEDLCMFKVKEPFYKRKTSH